MRLQLILGLILISLLIMVGGSYLWLESLTKPRQPENKEVQVFVVRKGQGINSIAESLVEKQFIKHPLGFKYIIYRYNLGKDIQAGSFKISPSMGTLDIARIMTHGSEDVWVTLLEGWRREEIAAAIEKVFVAKNSPFSIAKFIELTKDKEGYLFPDTYLFPLSSSESAIVSILENTFNQKVTLGLKSEIDQSNKNLDSIMVMASLIEREAKSETARKMVSGILWKRLDNAWPLQVDASLQYVRGFDPIKGTWWPDPLVADKSLNSPYNTYKNTGLPPKPICSPSLSSIKAALEPTPSDYWFYITGNDSKMHYAKTDAEHVENIRQYLR